MRKVIVTFGTFTLLFAFSTRATDAPSVRPGTYVAATEIKDALSKTDLSQRSDAVLRMFDAGNANIGVAVVHRPKAGKGMAGDAMRHSAVIEIYYVLQGRATMMTGGTVLDAKPFSSVQESTGVGPSLRGTSVDTAGSEIRTIAPGDIIFVPVGAVHYISEVMEDLTLLVYRVDPMKVAKTRPMPPAVVAPQ